MEDALLSKYDICATPRVIQFISCPHITGYSFKLCGTHNLFFYLWQQKETEKIMMIKYLEDFFVKCLLNLNATLKGK